jgi:manganese/zinc/iron transport system substrate-binding protein
MKRYLYSLLPIVLFFLAGCESDEEKCNAAETGKISEISVKKKYKGSYPIQVTCTTGMVADLARNIGGERVSITQLMGDGIDPHLYKASPGDVKQLSGADAVFYSGLHLEGKMTDVFPKMKCKKPVYPVAEFIPKDKTIDDEDKHDPHVWFDVSLWSVASEAVEKVLCEFDPPNAADYQNRGQAYRAELAEYARTQIATIPADRRVLVTAHDAFRYFGRAYNLEVRGIQGISTESEAGVREVNELVDFLVVNKIKAIFIESSVSDKNVRAIIEGCASRKHDIVVGGELYSDAMGKPGTPDGTYTGMVRHNVDTIVKALK